MHERIMNFVLENIQKKYDIDKNEIIDSLDYVAGGYVDSLGIVQFIIGIEDEFNIEFTDEELGGPKIRTVGGIVALVEEKLGCGQTT